MYKEDTIAAVATPPGEGGIAVVRVSGPDAEQIAAKLFIRELEVDRPLESSRLYRGKIRDPRSHDVIDEVLLVIMRKPRTYTGEDVVEIHCHGGVFLVREILGLILSHGARHAEAGEFTKRAFLNGRIDLTQAEGVLDLIQARTRQGARLAVKQLEGNVSEWVDKMRSSLLDAMVQVEAAIDFPEEEIELLGRRQLADRIDELAEQIRQIARTYEWGRLFREGAKVCICGRPNVGKSSLLNRLLGEERAIVTPYPGTTRDVIEESINLGGLPVVFWDTAGLRATDDGVEKIGVELSKKHIEKADLVLLVVDGSVGLTSEDQALLSAMGKSNLLVVNKDDLPRRFDVSSLERFTDRFIVISAKLGQGIEELKNSIRERLLGTTAEAPVIITNVRHRSALIRCEEALANASSSICEDRPAEFIAVDLNEARDALEEIVGKIHPDDILERIFERFCIGK